MSFFPLAVRRPTAGSVLAAVKGNRLFTAVLVAGVLLRVVAMLGFRGVLWFNDSYDFVRIADDPFPHPLRPSGYGIFLWTLKPFHSLALVTALQHAAVVGLAAAGYRMLVRDFDVRRPWAAAAVAPLLLDAYQLELEHLLLSDTLFTVLALGAMLVLAKPGATGWRRAALVGTLLGVAAVTRTVGVPLFLIAVVYLVVRRTRWPAYAALAVTFALPVGAYATWYQQEHGRFGMTGVDGIFLWGRTAAFADCDAHTPPADLASLCPHGPKDDRPASSHQIWEEGSPTGWTNGGAFDPDTNARAQRFAFWAIRNQPLDYAKVASYDFFVRTFAWHRSRYPTVGTEARYHFPTKPTARKPELPVYGGGTRRTVVYEYSHGTGRTHIVEPYAGFLRDYQERVSVPGTALGLVLLAGAAGIVWRRARARTALFWSSAVMLLAIPPATVDFDYRYLLPALPFACFAAAAAWGRRVPSGRSKAPPKETPGEKEPQPAAAP
ncbi:hypothetical protein [Actinomadura decatromicini]|uniref:Glycosyltransferase RgtA/B/C/D-like domain-containing protein n=1 Tax=Actinomadura decatromicini TaxID=2604572 RepID=A0A5D3FMK8_9ACTN|nr:hypothetical protein [Actinomadura decatromicini]TYK49222.1 hypothetical protein FXF68_15590 [Actinomadura decatromicini]